MAKKQTPNSITVKVYPFNHTLNAMQKVARAQAVADHLKAIGQRKCVCFTCGNASKALRATGLEVRQVLTPPRWFTLAEIQMLHGHRFDATSGHLSPALMRDTAFYLGSAIGKAPELKQLLETIQQEQAVLQIATGSGETLVTLKMVYPLLNVTPVYNLDASTAYHPKAPLNALVLALAYRNIIIDYKDNTGTDILLERVKDKLRLVD